MSLCFPREEINEGSEDQTTDSRNAFQAKTVADQCLRWYQTCVNEAREIGAFGMEGLSLLGWGKALIALDRPEQATENVRASIDCLAKAGATGHLEEARAVMEAIA